MHIYTYLKSPTDRRKNSFIATLISSLKRWRGKLLNCIQVKDLKVNLSSEIKFILKMFNQISQFSQSQFYFQFTVKFWISFVKKNISRAKRKHHFVCQSCVSNFILQYFISTSDFLWEVHQWLVILLAGTTLCRHFKTYPFEGVFRRPNFSFESRK